MTQNNSNVAARPAWFDAKLTDYLPGLGALAWRLTGSHDQKEDLYQETLAVLLHRWESYRVGGGFWKWAELTMRSVRHEKWLTSKRKVQTVALPEDYEESCAPATQFESAAFADAMSKLSGLPNADLLIRVAMGEETKDLAAERGISRTRINQKVTLCRKRLAKRLEMK